MTITPSCAAAVVSPAAFVWKQHNGTKRAVKKTFQKIKTRPRFNGIYRRLFAIESAWLVHLFDKLNCMYAKCIRFYSMLSEWILQRNSICVLISNRIIQCGNMYNKLGAINRTHFLNCQIYHRYDFMFEMRRKKANICGKLVFSLLFDVGN